jgi:hypothetical protein
MGLLDIFRRKPPIRETQALAEFVDENAAFLVQKGIYEYSRARAGHYSKVLFREADFLSAVEQSRWRTYPLGLAMVGEMVEGVLRPHSADHAAQQDEIRTGVLQIFDRYPVPAALGEPTWRDLRATLEQRLRLFGLHPVKRVMDVPEPYVQDYFDLLPIHEKLRARDFPTTRNYLRVSLCNIHDEFVRRADVPAVAAALALEAA